MAPQNDYGNIAVAEFQQAASRLGARGRDGGALRAGPAAGGGAADRGGAGQIDALFIPDQADGMPAVASALAAAGIKTQLLGTGVWNDARVLRLPQLQGAWFAAPDNAGFNAFAQRYKAKFGSRADAARDALLRRRLAGRRRWRAAQGPQPFSAAALTNPSGFNGADGVFRFRADGTNERGLAVMEIDNNAAVRDQPGAEESFAGGMSASVRQAIGLAPRL